MTSSEDRRDCLFCNVHPTRDGTTPWHDTPLATEPGVGGAIAGLGAFVPGYVLIFPDLHVTSIAQMPPRPFDSFGRFATRVAKAITHEYGPVTIFEHGSCPTIGIRRSACITHAHLHIIPGSYQLSPHLSSSKETTGATIRKAGYLFLREPHEKARYYTDPGVSQFFRRLIAAKLDIADQWDWLLFPENENVAATIERLRSRLL